MREYNKEEKQLLALIYRNNELVSKIEDAKERWHENHALILALEDKLHWHPSISSLHDIRNLSLRKRID